MLNVIVMHACLLIFMNQPLISNYMAASRTSVRRAKNRATDDALVSKRMSEWVHLCGWLVFVFYREIHHWYDRWSYGSYQDNHRHDHDHRQRMRATTTTIKMINVSFIKRKFIKMNVHGAHIKDAECDTRCATKKNDPLLLDRRHRCALFHFGIVLI